MVLLALCLMVLSGYGLFAAVPNGVEGSAGINPGINTGITAENSGNSIVVFPFKVTSSGVTAHKWLGRAFSVHLSTGLALNGFDAIADDLVVEKLEANHVHFPYNMTKASVLALAKESGARYLVWGDVVTDDNDGSPMKIHAFLLDLNTYKQELLLLLTGELKDLNRLEADLLKGIYKALRPDAADGPQLPAFNLKLHHYELLIKSLLLTDPARQAEMLAGVYEVEKGSDYLNIRLADCYVELGEYPKAAAVLETVSDHPFFKEEKRELLEKVKAEAET